MDAQYPCPECTAKYSSPFAARQCAAQDREDDLHARQQIRGKAGR